LFSQGYGVVTGLSFLGWLAWNQWRVWLQSLVSQTTAEALSTNAQLGSSKVYASIQLKHPGICQSIAQPSFPVIEEFAKPMSVGVTALSRLS